MPEHNNDEELAIYSERMLRLMRLIQIHDVVMTLPDATPDALSHTGLHWTIVAVIYSFYYSLIDDDLKGINFFRIWRQRLPAQSAALDALEARVAPHKNGLRLFRNRFGFHGSTSREHESRAFDLLASSPPAVLWALIIDTRNLSTALIKEYKTSRSAADASPTAT